MSIRHLFLPYAGLLIRTTAFAFLVTVAAGATRPASQASLTASELEKTLVQVIATCQAHDPAFPWRRTAPSVNKGYAVSIGNGLLLTTEELVRNHVLVEISRAKSRSRSPAKVLFSDYQVNLALLDISGEALAEEMTPIELATDFNESDPLTIARFDENGQAQIGTGRISEISAFRIPRSDTATLAAHVLTDIVLEEEAGSPVLLDGRLFGLVMQYDRRSRNCIVLPYPILERFIREATKPPYRGVASAGFLWEPLADPDKRAYLGLADGDGGILVLRALQDSEHELIARDVIVEWNGTPIDSQGYYEDTIFGRLPFSHLVRSDKPGNIAQATVIRDGEQMVAEVGLSRILDSFTTIPFNTLGEQAEYMVEGGMIIMELSLAYLEARGPRWPLHADPRLVHLWMQRHQLARTGCERVVILSRVLPDPINIGYEHLVDKVITGVNGEDISNLADVFRIADRDGHINRITLKSLGVDIVLDQKRLSEANARIAETYRIPAMRHQRPRPH